MKTVLAEQVTYFDISNAFLKFFIFRSWKGSKIDPLGMYDLEFC